MIASLLLTLTLAVLPVRADTGAASACRNAPGTPARADAGVADGARVAIPPARPPAVPRSGAWRFPADTADARRKVVIIDAGHGGRDPGRDGADGIREKNVTLALARRLAAELKDRGYEVHLTRTRDTLIALADRPRLANEWKKGRPATIFVSIHANAGERGAAGFETYFLSDARTEDERRVAEMENAAVDYEDSTAAAAPVVDRILNSLRNEYYVKVSDDLAELIQRHLGYIHPGPDRGVKQAGFRVLVGAIMPAVLVETGFMTSRREERLLATGRFQRQITRALADAIGEFFARHEWASGARE